MSLTSDVLFVVKHNISELSKIKINRDFLNLNEQLFYLNLKNLLKLQFTDTQFNFFSNVNHFFSANYI